MSLTFLASFLPLFVWYESRLALRSLALFFTLRLTLPDSSSQKSPRNPRIKIFIVHSEGVFEFHQETNFAAAVIFNTVPCGTFHFALVNDAKGASTRETS